MKTIFHSSGFEIPMIIDPVENKNAPTIIFIPGMRANATTDAWDWLAAAMNAAGFHFVRSDLISQIPERKFDESNLLQEVQTVQDAIAHLRKNRYSLDRFGIISKSFGVTKVALLQDVGLAAIFLLGPALFVSEVSAIESLAHTPFGQVEKTSEFTIHPSMQRDIPKHIIHGDKDEVVVLKKLKQSFDLLQGNKTLTILHGADHSFKRKQDMDSIKKIATDFFQKYLTI